MELIKNGDIGYAFKNGSGLFLARIQIRPGTEIRLLDVESISYTVYIYDEFKRKQTPIPGHETVELVLADVLFNQPTKDGNWPIDQLGYNFRHEPDASKNPVFPYADRDYQVEYRIAFNPRTYGNTIRYFSYRLRVI